MALGVSETLAEYLQNSAGEHLRCVLHYEDGDYSIVFQRSDLQGDPPPGAESIVEELLEMSPDRRDADPYGFGSLRCTFRCFERAVEMHFPHGDHTGTAVTLDPQVTEELYSFVGDCLTVIRTET